MSPLERVLTLLFGPRCSFGDGCTRRVPVRDRVGHWRARHDLPALVRLAQDEARGERR